jgi:hypothetical protein
MAANNANERNGQMTDTYTFHRKDMPTLDDSGKRSAHLFTMADVAVIVFTYTEAPVCRLTTVEPWRLLLCVERAYLPEALDAVRERLPITIRVDGSEWRESASND